MKNFYIDPSTYDLLLENNNIKLTGTTAEWLSSKIEAKLKTFYGEWFVNQTLGIPYFEEILKKQVDLDHIQVIFSDAIKNTSGVKELLSFEIDYDPGLRTYSFSFVVLSDNEDVVEGSTSV